MKRVIKWCVNQWDLSNQKCQKSSELEDLHNRGTGCRWTQPTASPRSSLQFKCLLRLDWTILLFQLLVMRCTHLLQKVGGHYHCPATSQKEHNSMPVAMFVYSVKIHPPISTSLLSFWEGLTGFSIRIWGGPILLHTSRVDKLARLTVIWIGE